MNEKDPTTRSQLRAIQYWYVDGSFEIGFGLLCLVMGIYFYLENLLQGSWYSALIDGALVLVVIGGSFLMNRVVRWWKEHVTFPRTGYISYARRSGLKPGWRILIGLAIGGGVGALVTYLFSREDVHLSFMPLLTGIFFSIVMAFVGWRTSLPRFYLSALASLLAGIGLAYSSLGNYVGLTACYLVISLELLVSGTIVLILYLRQHPVTREGQNEG